MPANYPGEAVEDLLHDVVVERLAVEVLLQGSLPVRVRIKHNVGQCSFLNTFVSGRESREDWRHDVVL